MVKTIRLQPIDTFDKGRRKPRELIEVTAADNAEVVLEDVRSEGQTACFVRFPGRDGEGHYIKGSRTEIESKLAELE